MCFGLLRVISTEFLWKWWIIEIPQGFSHKDFNATERILSTLHPSHASHRRPRVHPCLGWRSLPTLCLSSGLLHWLPGHSGSLFPSKPSMRAKITLLMTPVWCEVSGIVTKMQWGLNECRKQVENTASSLTYSNHVPTKSKCQQTLSDQSASAVLPSPVLMPGCSGCRGHTFQTLGRSGWVRAREWSPHT